MIKQHISLFYAAFYMLIELIYKVKGFVSFRSKLYLDFVQGLFLKGALLKKDALFSIKYENGPCIGIRRMLSKSAKIKVCQLGIDQECP